MQESILKYLPQRPPFVMIDELLQVDAQCIKASFSIREENILVKNGVFTEAGLVENMAQTAAAGTGFKAQQNGEEPIIGFIGALKNLSVLSLPKISETIITEIIFVHEIMNAHIVEGRIMSDGQLIANCELKIFLQKKNQ